MLTMNEFVDLRMQQQIAHEIYRQQIMQRIPDPFPPLLPIHMPHHVIIPPRPTLPGTVEAKLENNDLWRQFHKIGTEMIITKSGRRMFPSMRVSLSGLEEEANYCVLLEMVPIGDCRYKFSGTQWVPAGGAEPQSPQRMFLHPDSPATGAHWQSQATLFNKVKLTNNTLDSSGHIVLASMHKYQPRLHIIRTSDLTQLPWAPQQCFVFPETEFVAVTAYQNDRITKLKIDNNPFAKGFRETGQSRCKRKLTSVGDEQDATDPAAHSPSKTYATASEDDRSSISSFDAPQLKRMRSSGSFDDEGCFSSGISSGSISPRIDDTTVAYQHMPVALYQHHQHQHLLRALPLEMSSAAYLAAAVPAPQIMPKMIMEAYHQFSLPTQHAPLQQHLPTQAALYSSPSTAEAEQPEPEAHSLRAHCKSASPTPTPPAQVTPPQPAQTKRSSFSISAILAY